MGNVAGTRIASHGAVRLTVGVRTWAAGAPRGRRDCPQGQTSSSTARGGARPTHASAWSRRASPGERPRCVVPPRDCQVKVHRLTVRPGTGEGLEEHGETTRVGRRQIHGAPSGFLAAPGDSCPEPRECLWIGGLTVDCAESDLGNWHAWNLRRPGAMRSKRLPWLRGGRRRIASHLCRTPFAT